MSTALRPWVAAVAGSAEACVLLSADGCVVDLSDAAAGLLQVRRDRAIGALLAQLCAPLDFSPDGLPDPSPARALPTLRALEQGGMARGLVRLPSGGVRSADGPASSVTCDVVAVPVAGGAGVLSWFVPLQG